MARRLRTCLASGVRRRKAFTRNGPRSATQLATPSRSTDQLLLAPQQLHMRTSVVPDALEMALAPRKPRGVIHRLDQPCQYPSIALGLRCREAGVRPSIDSVGDSDRTVLTDYTMSIENGSLLVGQATRAARRWRVPCALPLCRASAEGR